MYLNLLFQPYIRREENSTRFRRAFWNVNSYGLRISNNIQLSLSGDKSSSKSFPNSKKDRKKIDFYPLLHLASDMEQSVLELSVEF